MPNINNISFKKIYKKLYQREYRPNKYFRIPVYVIRTRYAIKSGHPFFFSAINPGIAGMGFLDDTKTDTYKLLDTKYYPQSIEIQLPLSLQNIQDTIQKYNLQYPLIIKPDGDSVQGNNVYKIESKNHRKQYITSLPRWNYLLQEYIDGEEYSIYYYRYPTQKKWQILGITKKIYPTIIGDGHSNVWEIIRNHERYHRYYRLFKEKYHINMDEIISLWASKQLASIGNHCKWSMFLDRSWYSSENLSHHIDNIFQDTGLYLFRLDVKTPSRKKLLEWNFKIIESNNGIFAEPTYMYDPNYKIIDAYKQIAIIWYHGYKIAQYNHINKNIAYWNLKKCWNFILNFLKK